MTSQITGISIAYSNVCSGADQGKHQSSASMALYGEFTGDREFPAQRVSNVENVSILWRHHDIVCNWTEIPSSQQVVNIYKCCQRVMISARGILMASEKPVNPLRPP